MSAGKKFGKRLKELREKLKPKLSGSSLCEKADGKISLPYVQALEAGMLTRPPSYEKALILEQALIKAGLPEAEGELTSFTVSSSTIALVKSINENPKASKKLDQVLKKVHQDSSLLDKVLKLVNKQ